MLKFLFRALLVAALLVIAVWAFRSVTGESRDTRRSEAHEAIRVEAAAPVAPPSAPPAPPLAVDPGAASGLPGAPIPYDQLKAAEAGKAPPPAETAPQDKNTIFY
jgi:hypothetical protein